MKKLQSKPLTIKEKYCRYNCTDLSEISVHLQRKKHHNTECDITSNTYRWLCQTKRHDSSV